MQQDAQQKKRICFRQSLFFLWWKTKKKEDENSIRNKLPMDGQLTQDGLLFDGRVVTSGSNRFLFPSGPPAELP